jgi:hypothetical protein
MFNKNNKQFDLKLSNSEYYDLYLNYDDLGFGLNNRLSGDCFVVWYDFNNDNILFEEDNDKTIKSLVSWNNAVNTGYNFETFGLVGLDNGQLLYDKDPLDVKNENLVNILTGVTLTIPPNETSLLLHKVSGSTGQYVYPLEISQSDTLGVNVAKLCGGFYQGYYKLDGSTYEVLPNRTPRGWVSDFYLKKGLVCSGETGTTLNDVYPDNKGFFFYLGTRAENKFWNIFEGNNTGCTISCEQPEGCADIITNFCTELKESDIELVDPETGFSFFLNPPLLDIREITNQFLIYGRASKDGNSRCGDLRDNAAYGKERVCSFTGSSIFVSEYRRKKTDTRNQFLIYGRASKSGNSRCGDLKDDPSYGKETVCSYSGDSELILELDKDLDIIDNALGFRIKDDGSIGYRALKFTGYCVDDTYVTGVTVEEQYSEPGLINEDEWVRVTIRYVSDRTYNEDELKCLPARKGKFMIYVDCKLKAVFNGVDEFIARRLDDHYMKQVGVPYNISIGGGSQGLLEHMTFDGQDISDLGLNIEKNYAGSFVGEISEFKFYICDLNYFDISQKCPVIC